MIEQIINGIIASLQVAKVYTTKHPRFDDTVEAAYGYVSKAIEKKGEIIIGIVGEEFAFEDEILFDLSRRASETISSLKAHHINRIAFLQGLQKQEFVAFIVHLSGEAALSQEDAVCQLNHLGVQHIQIGALHSKEEAHPQTITEAISYLEEYERSAETVSQSIDSMLSDRAVDYVNLKATVAGVMDNLAQYYQEFLKLSVVKRYDEKTFLHLLNVAILSMNFAARLGFIREDCLEIGLAGLFHDLGKLQISRKIINKPGALTDEESSQIKSHALLGAQLLLSYVDHLGMLPVVVAFEHHLRYDLGGYPKVPFSRSLHMGSLIVAICDVYDALAQRRTYKRDYPPELIYSIMNKERGKMFAPDLLDRFFKIMGLWPRGTIVELTDGRIAVVRETFEDDISAPCVEIVPLQEPSEMIDLRAEKRHLLIQRSLNPLEEGKPYLRFI